SYQRDPVTQVKLPSVSGLVDLDVVWIGHLQPGSPLGSGTYEGSFYWAESYMNTVTQQDTWRFHPKSGPPSPPIELTVGSPPPLVPGVDEVRPVTLSITVFPSDPTAPSQVWSGLALDPNHQRAGAPDSVTAMFGLAPSNESLARTLPITIVQGSSIKNGLDVLAALGLASLGGTGPALDASSWDQNDNLTRTFDFELTGGSDGDAPKSVDYEGSAPDGAQYKTGLTAFEDLEDISIVAAPGSTFNFFNKQDDVMETLNLLIAHAENMRYRIAVLDCGDQMAVADVRSMRGQLDSTYAAFYYPWVKIVDPITGNDLNLPPSGFVAGIYARNDINRSVSKAPANEVVTLAIGFEKLINKGQQEVLNPEGINCFRFFEGRGYRLWGARLISSDPEWKYANLRRYFAYLERSIDVGTQWAVFEPNGPPLWTNVRRTISDFLFSEYQAGNLLGDTAAQAFFVRCDRTTMTQNDLDNGRMVCLIGVAPVYPAEFVIFRIGQWTASSTR
ncbi:MAG TPA: phage tail sheath subtilisin-like domain-containing protein, partial [Isosphaeraceae bacterium]|nr:phage tail sheath subtilisin-like domain-containing protein [Isosphaeraceae bacterium]